MGTPSDGVASEDGVDVFKGTKEMGNKLSKVAVSGLNGKWDQMWWVLVGRDELAQRPSSTTTKPPGTDTGTSCQTFHNERAKWKL